MTTEPPARADVHPARADVHQHLWTPPLLDALAARQRLPLMRRTDNMAILHCAGEQAWAIDVDSETPGQRADLVQADGLDLALVALSSPVGIEALPRRRSRFTGFSTPATRRR